MPKEDVANDMDIDDDVCRLGDDLDIDKGEVGDKVGGDVESPSSHLKRGPPLKDKVLNVSLHSNPRSKTQTTIQTLLQCFEHLPQTTSTQTPNTQTTSAQTSQNSNYRVGSGNDSEDDDDTDLFAENTEFGLDNVELGDEELRRIVDKEVNEESNRDVYYNEGDEEVCSDDEETLKDYEEGKTSYPTFNAEVDFKGKINLPLGLKFPFNSVF